MSYPESDSARCRSSSAADSDGALLSRIEPPLLDISSRVRQKKMHAEGKNPQYQSDHDERRVMIMTTMLVPEQSNQLAPRQIFPNNLKLKHRTAHTFGCWYNLPASVYSFMNTKRSFKVFIVNHRKPGQPNLSVSEVNDMANFN